MNNSMNFLDAIMNGDEEAMHYAVYLYEQAEKYRWHDLKKNPNDLPSEDGKYLVINSDREFDILYYCKNAKCFGYECCWTHDELPECPNEYYFEPIDEEESPIAWKEIEF